MSDMLCYIRYYFCDSWSKEYNETSVSYIRMWICLIDKTQATPRYHNRYAVNISGANLHYVYVLYAVNISGANLHYVYVLLINSTTCYHSDLFSWVPIYRYTVATMLYLYIFVFLIYNITLSVEVYCEVSCH